MTGDESRHLKVGDRVCWGGTTTDLGTIIVTFRSEVTFDWDDGESNSVSHNDMAQVERVPNKLVMRGGPQTARRSGEMSCE